MIITYEKIALLDASNGGLKIETFSTRLEVVTHLLSLGSIGGGVCYGEPSHLAALATIEKQIASVRDSILNPPVMETGEHKG